MIIQLTGNVQHPITLDPTVWIFDDRKVSFEEAFTSASEQENNDEDDIRKASQIWDREVYQQKLNPPINKSISTFEKKQILDGTFVMPIHHFLGNAQLHDNASGVTLETINGKHSITVDQLQNAQLLFAVDGKPIQEEGPVHIYFGDGSNQEQPIKGVKKIIVE
ncbi:hypothetical protein [Pontibacillus sp. HMF3514]|uniref:hypothetical protein n=1 Tax=Pontibacillus sp. HMF3514 TaxID=2692425 RepID=UPI00131F6755|nr:hypothetical protein [Pontibacillus sp. HMF3514]QHE52055.1 hypothetical protein GS400_08440 [Pontibacillus sp. HMF3514]